MIKFTTMAICLSSISYAQTTYSINGVVKDKNTGELITGAIIKVNEIPGISTISNEYGFYSIRLPEGDYTLSFTYTEYTVQTEIIHLDKEKRINPSLERDNVIIDEIHITGKLKGNIVPNRNINGQDIINIENASKIPMLLGERDVIRVLQFLPGVSSQEGVSGFSVRGGNTDQNLTLLDEAPVFNNSHLLGFFSNFNIDALRNVVLYKENIPSYYGGRLSSVVDVKMKEGNNQKYRVSGGIGVLSSRLSVEGPIKKGKSSFIISGRRTYLDLFLPKSDEGSKTKLYFYDLNAKLNYQINDKNTLYLSSYFGRDVFSADDFKNNWGNITSSLRWNSIVSSKLFSNTSLTYGNYDYKTNTVDIEGKSTDVNPNIENIGLRQDFSHFISSKHTFKYGLQASYYYFHSPNLSPDIKSDFLSKPRSMWESAIYFDDEYKISDKFYTNYGVRLSSLTSAKNRLVTNIKNFKKTYFNIEPRIYLNYDINTHNQIQLGYMRNTQNLQAINPSLGLIPNDIWVDLMKPEISDQMSLGYSNKINESYEFKTSLYYKKMSNLIDIKEGVQFDIFNDLSDKLLYDGKGRSYGVEILVKKNKGSLTGWISYTLSKSQRKIEGINEGEWYNSLYDKTHDLSIIAAYQLSLGWSVSGAFVYRTGNTYTQPISKYVLDGATFFEYGQKNGSRMKDYHRLDLNFTYESKNKKKFKSSWSFGVYNIYGNSNPYYANLAYNLYGSGKVNLETQSFTLIPNISYNFKF